MALLYYSISTNLIDFFVKTKRTFTSLLLESLKKKRNWLIFNQLRFFFCLFCTTNAPRTI